MNDRSIRIRNTICALLSLLLAAAVGCLIYRDYQQEKAMAEAVEALEEEARAYENELQNLLSELSDLEDSVAYSSTEAELMVGFAVSDRSDLSYIEEKAETYGFSPVLIIDCTEELADIEDWLDAADEEWELMLYASDFSETVNEDVLSVLTYLESEGRAHTGVFLLRDGYGSTSNIQLLMDDGFIGYTIYHSEVPRAGQTEDGAVYFDYSYLTTSGTSVSSRLSSFYGSKTSMIIIFDMASVRSGELTETYVTALFDTLQDYAGEDDCSFSTVADVVEELSDVNAQEAENQAAYEEQVAEIQERIDELQDIITEIYGNAEYS